MRRRRSSAILTAATAYADACRQARGLAQRIEELLAQPPRRDGVHWGHVGDLGEVNRLLAEAAAWLDGGSRS
jgi:hypothetical protein